MTDKFGRLRKLWQGKTAEGAEARRPAKRRPEKRTHNLFEAAAAYVSACAEDDQEQIDEAATWVSPGRCRSG